MLKYIQSFCILAEELHFNKAAARLHLTQPALTYQIKKLEQQLGCALLKRSPHKVVLTEAGAILARELGVALNHVNTAVQMAQDAARGESGALAIGYCELPQSGNMTDIVRRYATIYPGVDVALINIPTIEQPDALENGTIDVGFLHPPLNAPKLIMRPAGEEDMVLAMRADHYLASRQKITMMELIDEKLIVCSQQLGPIMYNQIVASCGRAGFQPKLREEMFRWHSMLDQAASGLGVAVVPASLCGIHSLLSFKHVPDLNVKLQTAIATFGEPTRPAVLQFLATARADHNACRNDNSTDGTSMSFETS